MIFQYKSSSKKYQILISRWADLEQQCNQEKKTISGRNKLRGNKVLSFRDRRNDLDEKFVDKTKEKQIHKGFNEFRKNLAEELEEVVFLFQERSLSYYCKATKKFP